jgi:hypothetical protein
MLRSVHFCTNATSTRLFTTTAHAYARPMSKPERFKEEIGWLKALGAALTAGLVSLGAWLAQNYGAVTRNFFLVMLLGLAVLALVIALVILRLYRCFKILEVL